MNFAIIYECREAISGNGAVVTNEGHEVVVVNDERGVTTSPLKFCGTQRIGGHVKKFQTREGAERFMNGFDGHPWYAKPNGKFRVVEIKPKFKQVFDKYEIKGES